MHSIRAGVLAAAAALAGAPLSMAKPAVPVYRCEVNGIVTFADRPCDASAQTYRPDASLVSTYQPPAPPATPNAPPAPRKRAPPASSKAAEQKRAAECERIRGSLREVLAKMRSGYSAKEGERLRTRRAQLNERRRALHCR